MPPFEVKFEAVIAAAASLEAKTPVCLLPAPKHDADVFEVDDGVDRTQRVIAVRARNPAGEARRGSLNKATRVGGRGVLPGAAAAACDARVEQVSNIGTDSRAAPSVRGGIQEGRLESLSRIP